MGGPDKSSKDDDDNRGVVDVVAVTVAIPSVVVTTTVLGNAERKGPSIPHHYLGLLGIYCGISILNLLKGG